MRKGLKIGLLCGVGIVGIAVVVLGYALIWGKLFPYSPIVVGFDQRELNRVVVYTEKGNPFTDYDWVDGLLPDVETFHGLTFTSKPRLFFFSNAATYARRSPSKARLCTFYNRAILVSPRAQQEGARGEISLRIYLRHELSHALLYENMSVWDALHYPRWLLEGIAMASANQMGTSKYPSRAETFSLIEQGNWMPPALFGTGDEDRVSLNVPYRVTFAYSQFGCMVEDLIDQFGRQRFLSLIKHPFRETTHDAVFNAIFGIDFDTYVNDFRARHRKVNRTH